MGRRKGRKMAEMVREAVDAFLTAPATDVASALERTFGAAPRIEVPSRDEWER